MSNYKLTGCTKGSIETDGMSLHYISKGEGPLVLCLHGFPDHADSFSHQIEGLAKHGFRVVAPYMRGIAPSLAPQGSSFQTAALGLDAVAIIEALGGSAAAVIGHDWGSPAAAAAAIAAPDRIGRLVLMSVPYGPALFRALIGNPAQQLRSWYMFLFQLPFAEMALAHDDFALIDRLWRAWSPDFVPEPSAMETLKSRYRTQGVANSALSYYRQALNPVSLRRDLDALQAKIGTAPIGCPTLYLHGADDGCIGAEIARGQEPFFHNGLTMRIVSHAGHFLHLEKPDEVTSAILDFLS